VRKWSAYINKFEKAKCSNEIVCPWDYLANPADEHFSNYVAWEKWIQSKDKDGALDELDTLAMGFLYATMFDLIEAS